MAEKKAFGHLTYRVAMRRRSLNLSNMIWIRLRSLSYFTGVSRCFQPGIQAHIPLSFNASLNQSCLMAAILKQPFDISQAVVQRLCANVVADLARGDE